MYREIYTIYLPIGTVATCEYCGKEFLDAILVAFLPIFTCVWSLFFWTVAPRQCAIGAGRLETTLEDETATLSGNGGHR
jgi:hypothetical protein